MSIVYVKNKKGEANMVLWIIRAVLFIGWIWAALQFLLCFRTDGDGVYDRFVKSKTLLTSISIVIILTFIVK